MHTTKSHQAGLGAGPEMPTENSGPGKAALRKIMLARRAALPAAEAARLSGLIQAHILSSPAWQNASQVLIYSPIRNEVDTALLFADALATGKQVLFPRCLPGQTGIMELAVVSSPEDLKPATFGILEPDPERCPALHGEDLRPGIVVLPGVGFDRQGFRLGYGAGYYDRALKGAEFRHAYLVGAAYAVQIVDDLRPDPWDQRLTAVVTEDGVLFDNNFSK